jgi:hypothetical protein
VRPEDKLLFACARQAFTPVHQQRVIELDRTTQLDWTLIQATAAQHGVAPLIYANLATCTPHLSIPPAVQQQFERSTYATMLLKTHVARQISACLTFLHGLEVAVMLIKGAALDLLVYERSWYTVHDVDLVLKPHHGVLSAAAQRQISAFFAKLPGFEYEFFAHHDVVMNGVLPVDFHQIWRDARQLHLHGQPLWVMSAEDLLLSACINSCRKRFFRLKSLVDINEIIAQERTLDWAVFIAKAKRSDCQHIAYTALLVTQQTLGCDLVDGVLAQLQGSRLRRSIIHSLSQRLSLDAFSTRDAGLKYWRRTINWPLLLPYATFAPYQIGRRLAYVWRTRVERA